MSDRDYRAPIEITREQADAACRLLEFVIYYAGELRNRVELAALARPVLEALETAELIEIVKK
jgi:hypothetical protein